MNSPNTTLHDTNSFQEIFSGNTEAYGRHVPNYDKDKIKKTGRSYTVTEQISFQNYYHHLKGEEGLGIVPLTSDGHVKFIAIDIDNYDKKYTTFIVDKIYNNNIPLVPFKTKSGGLHLYLFLDKFYEYIKIKDLIREFIPVLGLDNKVEIFPKQLRLKQGQIGNWINLPYFNGKKTNQYLISKKHEGLSLPEAIMYINKNKLTEEKLQGYVESLCLRDAPPCLQTIYYNREVVFRNEYLFGLATYLKSKNEDTFEYDIIELNNDLLKPLPVKEISETIVKSHKRKDYTYKCNMSPLKEHCSKEFCKERKFGVGGSEISQLSFEEFIQYTSDPPYYEWIVNKKSLTFFNETEIINQQKFRELCFRELHILPVRLKDVTWTKIINRALNNIVIKEVESDEDMSPGSIFMFHLYSFLEDRVHAENLSQILIDRVYKDDQKNIYIFRGQDLLEFIYTHKNFRYFKVTEIQNRLKKMEAINIRMYIDKNNKGVRVWKLAYEKINNYKTNPENGLGVDFTKMEGKDEQPY